MLSRSKAFHDFLTNSPFLQLFYKILNNFEIDISFQKSQLNFTHRLFNIFFAEFSLSLKFLKSILQSFSKTFKNHQKTSLKLNRVLISSVINCQPINYQIVYSCWISTISFTFCLIFFSRMWASSASSKSSKRVKT